MTKRDVGNEVLARDVSYNGAKKLIEEAVAEGVYKGGQRLIVLLVLVSIAMWLLVVLARVIS